MSAVDRAQGATPRAPRNKTLATWLALVGGGLGLHRFYLHGWRDPIGWLFPWPTLAGVAGVIRMRNLGQDDHVSWLLIPIGGLMLSVAMLSAIVIGLTPDERWAERRGQPVQRSGWLAIIGVVVALLLGGALLMGTMAFGGQKFFEAQLERDSASAEPAAADQNSQKPHQ